MGKKEPASLEGLHFGFIEEQHTWFSDTEQTAADLPQESSHVSSGPEQLTFLGSYNGEDSVSSFHETAVPYEDENREEIFSPDEQTFSAAPPDNQKLTGAFSGFDKAFLSRNPVTNYSPEEIAFAKSIYNTSLSAYSGYRGWWDNLKEALTEMFAQPPLRLTIWIFLSVLLTLVPTIFGEMWVIVLFTFQTIPGLLLYHYGQKTEHPAIFKVFLFVMSAVCLTLGLLRWTNPDFLKAVTKYWWQLSLVGLFDNLCVGIMLIAYIRDCRKKQNCSEQTMALCFDLLQKRVGSRYGRRTVYCPIYEYTYQGRLYRVRSTHYSGISPPRIGGQYILQINPYDPSDFYDGPQATIRLLTTTVACIVGILFSFLICYQILSFAV